MQNSMTDDAVVCFHRYLCEQWLPAYCHDPRRRYSLEGYQCDYRSLAAIDAGNFIYTLSAGIVNDTGGGRYRARRSKANEVIFWEGSRKSVPRTITLWLEPIITIAAVGRLHRDYGWPAELLGLQSKDWAFDLVAYDDSISDRMVIAGEVKKSVRELECMIEYLCAFANDPETVKSVQGAAAVNAARKWLALAAARPPLFWAVGPGNGGELFAITYDMQGPRSFDPLPLSNLAFTTDA
jgi:hypothetical protein